MCNRFSLSIGIPTYRGLENLKRFLPDLIDICLKHELAKELIIVDNNSDESPKAWLESIRKKLPADFTIRFFIEYRQGAAYARNRCVKEATGDIVILCDDDVALEDGYLDTAYTYLTQHPKVAVCAGKLLSGYRVPPNLSEDSLKFVAIRDRGDLKFTYTMSNLDSPPSAALAVRRDAWMAAVPDEQLLTGRTGGSLIAGDDPDALLRIWRCGGEVHYLPELIARHHVKLERFDDQYLLKLARETGKVTATLLFVAHSFPVFCIRLLKMCAGCLVNLSFGANRVQRNPSLEYSLGRQFLIGSLLSPVVLIHRLTRQFYRSRLSD